VKGQYRRLTPELRADHIAALAVLRRGVVALPPDRLQWRNFIVVTARATIQR